MWECIVLVVLALLALLIFRRTRESFGFDEKLPMYEGTFNAVLPAWIIPGVEKQPI